MATIDASGLQFAFDGLSIGSVRHQILDGVTPTSYSWVTGTVNPFYRITALSFSANITTAPVGGTINAVYFGESMGAAGFSVTGLNTSLAAMIDTANEALHQNRFWSELLSGATTIVLPSGGQNFSVMGDFVFVAQGLTRTGSADTFLGAATFSSGTLIGDARFVELNATLTGGADRFTDTSATTLVGDVGDFVSLSTSNLGRVNGGNDIFSLIDLKFTPDIVVQQLIGDVVRNGSVGTVYGGRDSITLRDIDLAEVVAGDIYTNNGTSFGGNDTILLETTVAGRAFASADSVVGDDLEVNGTESFASSTGGNDTITLNSVDVVRVSGDFSFVVDATATGGNDTIRYVGTMAETTPAPAYPITPTSTYVTGDVVTTSGASTFTGGDDSITVTRVVSSFVSGDAVEAMGTGSFTGGDDTISVLFNRRNEVAPVYLVAGDSYRNGASSFTGGNDSVAVNIAGALPGSQLRLFGDSGFYLFEAAGNGMVRNGDDTVRFTSSGNQSAILYGDGETATSSSNLTLTDGNDTLIGGNGHDWLFGDTRNVSFAGSLSRTGGNDVLDGRGGNDVLDGGLGNDTAVFSLDQSVYVDLNGIGGGADPFEAIGQGNDQLIGIENVTGSSEVDVIIGDGGYNILQGMAGADFINGGAGLDTASYALSNTKVTVNLSTGVTSGGHAQGDTLVSIERLTGSAFDDSLVGNNGANVLDGGAGADMLRGLGGDDVYVIDNAGDVVDEAFTGSGGTDTVRASISVDLRNTTQFKGDIEKVALIAGITGLSATGNGLANTITGNALGNTINGGLGNDSLAGGGGADKFVFNTALGATNIDRITDFAVDDTIQLENAIFTLLTTTGTLAASRFKNTANGAVDADDRIVYNHTNGALSYDTNGSAAGGATQFATLSAGLALTNADFVVI